MMTVMMVLLDDKVKDKMMIRVVMMMIMVIRVVMMMIMMIRVVLFQEQMATDVISTWTKIDMTACPQQVTDVGETRQAESLTNSKRTFDKSLARF